MHRVYDGISSSSWEDGMNVTSSIALGRMEWMSDTYLQCQQGETLNVRLNSFIGGESSRCGVRWKVHVIRGADAMYNSRSSDRVQLQISSAEAEVIASNFIRPQLMI